jgi:hypothetical protein
MPGIKIDILGVKELQAKLDKLPVEVADEAIGDVQDYLLNVLRMYPPKNSVSRAAAYPDMFATTPTGKKIPGYKSWRQFKYVMWLVNSGKVPYGRTQALSRGWHKVRSGIMGYLVNYTPYGVFVMGERKQSRHEQMVGWKKPSEIIKERLAKINQIIDEAAKKAIRKLGL